MPVKFSQGTLLKMLLSGCNIGACRNISDNLLTNPTARKEPGLGLTEAPFEVGHRASICTLSTEVVRVLQINLDVCST